MEVPEDSVVTASNLLPPREQSHLLMGRAAETFSDRNAGAGERLLFYAEILPESPRLEEDADDPGMG